jgi:hypothetical protein
VNILKIAHKADVVKLGRVCYNDDNAIVRQKTERGAVAVVADEGWQCGNGLTQKSRFMHKSAASTR